MRPREVTFIGFRTRELGFRTSTDLFKGHNSTHKSISPIDEGTVLNSKTQDLNSESYSQDKLYSGLSFGLSIAVQF